MGFFEEDGYDFLDDDDDEPSDQSYTPSDEPEEKPKNKIIWMFFYMRQVNILLLAALLFFIGILLIFCACCLPDNVENSDSTVGRLSRAARDCCGGGETLGRVGQDTSLTDLPDVFYKNPLDNGRVWGISTDRVPWYTKGKNALCR